ncbi:MAG: CPBP family intramembrane glutamic endopeptidase [Opitutaceae bacterium]|nr:CPBP family intramembrane glutamic endopeptidase [Opitutaceae bacterium]
MSPAALSTTLQCTLLLAGAILGYRRFRSERQRARANEPHPLPLWEIEGYAFAFAVLRVVVVTFGFQFAASSLMSYFQPGFDFTKGHGLLFVAASSQVGMLLGLAIALHFMPKQQPPPPWEETPAFPPRLASSRVPLAAIEAFLITTAAVTALTYAWRFTLQAMNIDAPEQEMVELLRLSDGLGKPLTVVLLACVLAPVTEEAIFRGGLFRFARGRMPRYLAFLIPSLLFGLVHFSLAALPGLILLSLLFSYAYERTGRIAVPMIAHALFNLNTLVLTLVERGNG